LCKGNDTWSRCIWHHLWLAIDPLPVYKIPEALG
jgi:hypothetical protein